VGFLSLSKYKLHWQKCGQQFPGDKPLVICLAVGAVQTGKKCEPFK